MTELVDMARRLQIPAGKRSFELHFPVTLEVTLEHQVSAISEMLSGIRKSGSSFEAAPKEQPRMGARPLPIVVVKATYGATLSDGEVGGHVRVLFIRCGKEVSANAVVPPSVVDVPVAIPPKERFYAVDGGVNVSPSPR